MLRKRTLTPGTISARSTARLTFGQLILELFVVLQEANMPNKEKALVWRLGKLRCFLQGDLNTHGGIKARPRRHQEAARRRQRGRGLALSTPHLGVREEVEGGKIRKHGGRCEERQRHRELDEQRVEAVLPDHAPLHRLDENPYEAAASNGASDAP